MNRIIRWGIAASLLPIAACSSPPTQTVTTISAPPPPPPASLAASDVAFVNAAATGGLTEVQLGQIAATIASRPAIMSFGKAMVDQHTANDEELAQIAVTKGLTVPTAPTAQQQDAIARLQTLHGAAFDRAYLANQIASHRQMLAAFEQEAKSGTDPDLKAFAAKSVPIIQQHLAMAQRLAAGRG